LCGPAGAGRQQPGSFATEVSCMPLLLLKLKGKTLNHYYLTQEGSLTIGRSPENDVVIPNMGVSGHHARIDHLADGYLLTDLNSSNGTMINDRPIATHWLQHGDRINLVKHTLVFAYMRGERRPQIDDVDMEHTMIMDSGWLENGGGASEPIPAETSAAAHRSFGVLALLEGGSGEIVLDKKRIRLGKDPEAEIVVRGIGIANTAAAITRGPDGYFLSYEGGLTRVRLNGRPVKQPRRLQEQDLIEIGAAKIRFFIR
jgi:pSer/pThr/pTyr-binding forkhead associated (FHA) protein